MVVVLVEVGVLVEVLVRGRGNGGGSRSRRRGRSRTGTEAAENDVNVIAVTYVYKRHSSARAALDGGNHAPPYIMNPDSDEITVLSRYRVVQNLLHPPWERYRTECSPRLPWNPHKGSTKTTVLLKRELHTVV